MYILVLQLIRIVHHEHSSRFAPPNSVGFINAQSNLRILSDQVEYTNGTLYAPFGSSLVVTCEGGMGEKMWYNLGLSGSKIYVDTDLSQTVYQSSGQLFLGDFQRIQAVDIFCEDESPSTVFTRLMEGVFNIQTLVPLLDLP